jgi:Tfp pilus assembly protein PilZ
MLVKYIVVTESEFKKRVDDTLTKDISVKGVRFETDEKLPPGTRLVLELNLPDVDHPVTPSGRVAWCRPKDEGYEVGVELIWLSFQENDQLALADYINSRLEKA